MKTKEKIEIVIAKGILTKKELDDAIWFSKLFGGKRSVDDIIDEEMDLATPYESFSEWQEHNFKIDNVEWAKETLACETAVNIEQGMTYDEALSKAILRMTRIANDCTRKALDEMVWVAFKLKVLSRINI